MRLEKPFCGNTRKIMLMYLFIFIAQRDLSIHKKKKNEKIYAFREKTRIFLTLKKPQIALDPNHHSYERLCTKLSGSLFRKKGYIYRMPGYFAVCWELWKVYNLVCFLWCGCWSAGGYKRGRELFCACVRPNRVLTYREGAAAVVPMLPHR